MQFIGLVQQSQWKIKMPDFTKQQRDYINSSLDEHVYLEACPGSGKTEVVAVKVAREMDNWCKNPSGMAILSFSNSATDELKERISKFSSTNVKCYPHFAGTFDSFIFKHIVSPVAHVITNYEGKDGDYSIRLVENTSSLFIQTSHSFAQKGKQKANQYDYDLRDNKVIFNHPDKKVNKLLNNVKIETWQKNMFDDAKNKFYKAGFATYRDIELLAIKVLSCESLNDFKNNLAIRFPFIIIDECQDLSYEQLLILELLIRLGVKIHFIGDLNQSIYEFRNADPANIIKFIKEMKFKPLPLPKNHRSVQPIVDLCTVLVRGNPIIGRETAGLNHCVVLEYDNCPTEVLSTFFRLSKNYKNSVIVARGHSTLNKFNAASTKLNEVQKLALAITLFDESDFKKLEQSITLLSQFLRNQLTESVKPISFNCPESVTSPLRWRQFLFKSLDYMIEDNLNDSTLTWKVWCGRVKARFKDMLNQPFVDDDISFSLKGFTTKSIRSPNKLGEEELYVSLKVSKTTKTIFRKATVHKVKGETHEATMFVSSPGKQGSVGANWKEWIENPTSEAARIAYVASSRPRELLIWAVKKLKLNEQLELEKIGFKILPLDCKY
jgi:hypothetical protein